MSRWFLMIVAAAACAGCAESDVSRALGARCDSRDECDERCLAPASYPGGFCTLSCDDDSDCPGDSRCIGAEGGVCMFACELTAADDCTFLGITWECTTATGKPDGEVDVCTAVVPL